MTDRSGLYGLVGIIVLIGVSWWGILREPVQARVVEPQPAAIAKAVQAQPEVVDSRKQWEALTAEVAAYHAQGKPAPSDLLDRQLAAFVQLQGEMRRNVDALSRELSALRAQGTGNY